MIFVYGDIILDILVESRGKLNYGSDTTASIKMRGGGSPANFAAWASYLGSDVYFAGRLGDDPAALYLKGDLDRWGVTTSFVMEPEAGTGKIVLFIDDQGERTMVTDRDVNLCFHPEDLPLDTPDRFHHLHLTGYNFFGSRRLVSTAKDVLKWARKNELTISLDPSSYALLEDFDPNRFLALTEGCDYIFPNYDEGRILSNSQQPEAIVDYLLNYYRVVVLKLGAEGSLVGEGDNISFIPVEERTEAVDTTGAGDAYAAAFINFRQQGKNLHYSAEYAGRIALKCIKKSGGRPPIAR